MFNNIGSKTIHREGYLISRSISLEKLMWVLGGRLVPIKLESEKIDTPHELFKVHINALKTKCWKSKH